MRFLTAGTRTLLVEVGGLEEVGGLHESLRDSPPPGAVEFVPAARTLLVTFDPAVTTRESLSAAIAARRVSTTGPSDQRLVEIPVVYDGADLAEVARATGLSSREVVQRHSAGRYTVAFGGFVPGFAYLSGLDPLLLLPRRPVPRTRVAPGSVAIADQFTSVYPRESPGGWHLLGRTETAMWDLHRDPPAFLAPGRHVRFVEVQP
ncbi:allophanate hydrolase subunit 1 [Kitasatospora sp. MAP5-34]|uniref:5-oxoprolinase subunit B family protein n=1 Tax=Kitasatospora sp. MAP5-34 TaxID=3035102 RepID=UPI0024761419|nr:allophanate hydrolase subunit 1 [Kitasatospora sp. MAP5-34]MDH6574626.1 KipI family sensor histidine kinase inhibitor [Kitasatospora sp. MAP5-34]